MIGSRDADRGEAAARAVEAAGGVGLFQTTDVGQASQVEALVVACVARFGRLDCAFNNAATGGPGKLCADIDEEEFDRTIAVNLRGAWLCMKHEIRQMLRQGCGPVPNLSTVDWLTRPPQRPGPAA